MDIKDLLARRNKIDSNENRPVRSIEIGPNMWQIVYADEPLPKQYSSLQYNYSDSK